MSRIAIIGSGSWATALAKIVLTGQDRINWCVRRQETIDAFVEHGQNPGYLNNVHFDTDRIYFSTNINDIIVRSDVLILAVPSPYLGKTLNKIRRSLRNKVIVSAVKGMIAESNQLVTDYLHEHFAVPMENMAVIAGPCHAEEIALDRLSYLTIGSVSRERAVAVSQLLAAPYVRTSISTDINGLEYSSVMKNIYAIAAGMCHSLRYGDNFQAVLISNAIQEIQRFIQAVENNPRDVSASGYLGDVLVTAYSRFSRNRQFGSMIGMGYSVKAAQIEMNMIAEGYYGTQCIHQANEKLQVKLPIMEAMYDILYKHLSPTIVIQELTLKIT